MMKGESTAGLVETIQEGLAALNDHHTQDHHGGHLDELDERVAGAFLALRKIRGLAAAAEALREAARGLYSAGTLLLIRIPGGEETTVDQSWDALERFTAAMAAVRAALKESEAA